MKLKHLSVMMALAVSALVPVAIPGNAADYPTTVSGLNPVVYYRLNTTTPMPTEYSATNIGTLGTADNGEYQIMSGSRGLAGAIAGDADTAVSIAGATGQQVVVPFSAAYNPSGPFTVEFWAKPANVDSGSRAVATSMINGQNAANGDDRSGWVVRQNGSDWEFILGFDHSDGSTFYHTTLNAPGAATAEVWQHVAAVYTPETVRIYVNGVEVANQPPTQPVLPNFAAPLILGDRGYTGWDYNGLLDEFVIYTNALTADEVLAHYSSGTNSARTTAYKDLVLQKNPPLYLRLGEPSLVLPAAVNSGSFGAAANGTFLAGSIPGVPGPQTPAVTGFETTNAAAGFAGVNSGSVQLPGINLNSDTVTMLCWVKPDGVQATRAAIMHNRKTSTPEVKATGLGFQDDGRSLSYNWEDQASAYNFNPGFAPPLGAWTFVAVTISPEEAVMYMGSAKGLQAATNAIGHSPHDFSGTTMELGWDNYQAARVFKGALDEFAMFDKTLTYAQVQSLFEAALPAILGVTRTPADPVYEGMTVQFAAEVAPTTASLQWSKDGALLAEQTNALLVLNSVVTNDSGTYELQAFSGGKTVSSGALGLTVSSSAPLITEQPVGGTRFIGGSATLSVGVLGSVPMLYQWLFNNTAIAGATGPTLVLPSLLPGNMGDYSVRLTNPYGSTNSATVTLNVVAPTNYAGPMMAAGPLAYWRLNETSGQTAVDSAGGFDATYRGNITNGVSGPALSGISPGNTAYQFNGAGAYLEAPASLDVERTHFTISAWIKVNAWDKTWQAIVTKGDSSWRLHRNGDETQGSTDALGFGTTGLNQLDLAGNINVADGQWHHVAAVYDGEAKYLYVDGALDVSLPAWGTVSSNNYPVTIGENAQVTGRSFNGSIDEVALFNRGLSAAEIQHLYQQGTSTTVATPQIVQQPVAQTVYSGQPVSFSTVAIGGAPYFYQWKHDGTDVPGAVGAQMHIANATFADTGAYTVTVSNSVGTITSQTVNLTVLPPPDFANLTNGLVLHLKFDGDYKDSSGRGNDGTAQGQPEIVAGKIGTGALHYSTTLTGDSLNQANYVSLGTPADLDFGTNVNFSIGFWIKFVGSPGDLPFLSDNTGSVGGPGVTIAPSWQEGGWSWGLNDSTGSQPWPGIGLYDPVKNTLNDGNWHHLLHTFDRAGDGTTYVDGVAVHSMSIRYAAGWDLNSGMEWDIGQAGGGYAVAGDFTMDDLGIWRRTLQPSEVEALYVVGQTGKSFDTYGPVSVRVLPTSTGLDLIWQAGTLESVDSLGGNWQPVTGAAAPYYRATVSGNQKFYRVKL